MWKIHNFEINPKTPGYQTNIIQAFVYFSFTRDPKKGKKNQVANNFTSKVKSFN